MIHLHGSYSDDRLLLWTDPETTSDAIEEALDSITPDTSRRGSIEATAWLPTRSGVPVFSPTESDSDCTIAPHSISAVRAMGSEALELLALVAGKRIAAPGLLIADDLQYWATAMRFTANLVIRGQYLPSLTRAGVEYEARWTPVISASDAARVEAISKAMPPSARAVVGGKDRSQPDNAALTTLRAFIAWMLDAIVRGAHPQRAFSAESLHDRWHYALLSEDPTVTGSPEELAALAKQIQEWQRPVRTAAAAPFRLAFRLHEPDENEQNWRVEYLLQGAKDQSLLVPAAKAWKPKRSEAAALGDTARLKEHLLVSLGQAAQLSSKVEESLRESAPEGFITSNPGAHEFLRDTAPALEQAGFGVMLPSWWTGRSSHTRLQARARVKSGKSSSAGLTLETLVDFNWQLALGGEVMSRSELVALARMKQPLVKVRGQWVEVSAEDIQAALDFLKRNPGGRTSVRDLVHMQIGVNANEGPVEIGEVSANGAIGELLRRLQERTPETQLPPPKRLIASLRPYQVVGYSWLDFLKRVGLGACLADDMGLGKTIQTLALLQREREQGETRPILLVCPTSVVGNWQKEASRFTPDLPVVVHHGASRKRGGEFHSAVSSSALVLSSYALLQRDQDTLAGVDWAGLILDEAQNIKNAGTKQARAARSIAAGYRIALTGTPVENNVADLWSLMEFLNPGILGSESAFRKRFFVPIQVYSDAEASARLRRITSPFILRRLKTDKSIIADLPDKFEAKVFCNLTKEQASLYEAVVKDAQAKIESAEGIERKGLVLATLLKLKQVCNHPAQFLKDKSGIEGRSGKLARLKEMLEEVLELGDRSLIFTQFTEMGDLIQRHLQEEFGAEVLYLHGGTPKKSRDSMVERFADPAGPRVFLLSLKAGGTGLNLVQANHVFHFDRWWNPAVENQATDRAFRLGQTKNVQVHKFVCVGTLEEKIDEMIENKKNVAGKVVVSGETLISEMSNKQLRELFALRRDAIGE